MISKKNINIALIVLLLVIWGSIGYRYLVKKKTMQQPVIAQQNSMPTQYTIRKDTFELKNIKNPFQSVFVRPKTVQKLNTKKTTSKRKSISKKVIWPSIQYHGYVVKKGSSKKLGIITVNGKIIRKREKELILETFKIKKIYEDSIQFEHQNSLKTLKKQ